MARYRKVDVAVWVDEKVCRLSRPQPCGLSLWLYLITNPSTTNIPGLYRAGEASLAEDLEWPLEGFREAFAEVFREGLAEADWKKRVVWLPRATKYNHPESPNVVRSWAIPWSEIPECPLKDKAFQHLKAFTEGLGKAFVEAFVKACGKPSPKALPNPEPEPEQDPEGSGEAIRPSPLPPLILAPQEPPEQPILVFSTIRGAKGGGSTWGLRERDLALLRQAYPGVDVLAECRQALLWTAANPAKQKTASGMLAFLNRWMARAQNRGMPAGRNGAVAEVHQSGRTRWTGRP